MERVILVDESDHEMGNADREVVHREGRLHRAVSVFIINGQGELLLQRRASTKGLFAGMWANTCCTHPRPGESVAAAAERRLLEEMGMDLRLKGAGTFIYHAEDQSTGYIEHELDHVLVGRSEEDPVLNTEETDAFSWTHMGALRREAGSNPKYAPWLHVALEAIPNLGA